MSGSARSADGTNDTFNQTYKKPSQNKLATSRIAGVCVLVCERKRCLMTNVKDLHQMSRHCWRGGFTPPWGLGESTGHIITPLGVGVVHQNRFGLGMGAESPQRRREARPTERGLVADSPTQRGSPKFNILKIHTTN